LRIGGQSIGKAVDRSAFVVVHEGKLGSLIERLEGVEDTRHGVLHNTGL
jgi:hypothetical protein